MTALLHDAPLDPDELIFSDDPPPADEAHSDLHWRILIVDDEPDVHQSTTFALAGLTILKRRLEFLHAYGATDATRMLQTESAIAVVLLDVVMEREDSGLKLVRTIREELALDELRIILLTGQPGYAPELQTIHDYDINDYRTKSELTRTRLYATVTAALRAYSQIRELDALAYYDRLLALPNRNRFIQLIDHRLNADGRDRAQIAIVDIDDFSEVNDALGHRQGDRLLLSVAERLAESVGSSVQVARIGSDAFGLIGDASVLEPTTMQQVFRRPFDVFGDQMVVSASIGVARLTDVEGNGHDALKDASIALKRAKKVRRGGHVLFSAEMGAEIRERVRLLQGLRSAVERERLFVAYQPQVRLSDQHVVGAEALIRWRNDEGEFIPPDRFIPLAETSGLVIAIGEWVLRTACHLAVRLHASGHAQLRMSVNVSQIQFQRGQFVDTVRAAIEDSGIDPALLELEITESVAMEDPDLMLETLHQLKQLGVTIAIDDFGTGYSSLSQLRLMPADRLKIDRAFVHALDSGHLGGQIAAMVVDLAGSLGMTVIAEGVELEGQADTLRKLGCTEAQGYLFARPMSAPDLEAWLAAGGPGARPPT